jgi:hypothetical protein
VADWHESGEIVPSGEEGRVAKFRVTYEPDWMADEEIEADRHDDNDKTLDFYLGEQKVASVDRSQVAGVVKHPEPRV